MNREPVMREIDTDYGAAHALALRVTEDKPRALLVKACQRALNAERDRLVLEEIGHLLDFWRSMPEHITGGTAIHQLAAVLAGGFSPGPKGRR